MLSAAKAASFLDAALDDELASMAAFSHQPGDLIGHYQLVEELGHGGFGTVWRAVQTEPIVREVALKIVRGDMDSAPAILRFRVERQALARMEHPGIAHAIEAGATPTGELFFAMELVRGSPITEYCEAKQLNLKQRVELLIQVCRAVEHAHQKAVLHRDLKPANILVTEIDGKPMIKIIDFGIAKALTGDVAVSQAQALTQAGLVIGTFDYMAPEQAEPGKDADDIRVDVYALGVVLYEMIVGVTPLRAALGEGSASTMQAMLGAIVDAHPQRPSEELSRRVRAGARVPHGLTARSVGTLDWVALKALAKDSSQRYSTAGALAADLQNYLDDQPLSVGMPSVTTRLVRLASRHRAKFAIGIGVGIAAAVASVIASLAYVREATARDLAERMRIHAEASERLARQESQRALTTITFLSKVLGEAGAQVSDGKNADALRAALSAGEELVAKLDPQDELRASLEGHLAAAYEHMEDVTKAIPLRKAQLGILEKKLKPNHPLVLEAMVNLAGDYRESSNHALAAPIYQAVADRYEKMGRADTKEWFEAVSNYGSMLAHLKRQQEAMEVLHALLDRSNGKWFGREDPSFLMRLATVEGDAGNYDTAEARLYEALDRSARLFSSKSLMHRRASMLESLARIKLKRGKPLEAAQKFDESIALDAQSLGETHPSLIRRGIEAARCYAQVKLLDPAMEHIASAEAIAVQSGNVTQQIHCLRARAEIYMDLKQDAEALAAYQAFLPRLHESSDARPALKIDVHSIIVTLHSRLQHHADAMKAAGEVWQILNAESRVANDDDLWKTVLQRLNDAAKAAAKADPTLPEPAARAEWETRLAKLNQVTPAAPALPAR